MAYAKHVPARQGSASDGSMSVNVENSCVIFGDFCICKMLLFYDVFVVFVESIWSRFGVHSKYHSKDHSKDHPKDHPKDHSEDYSKDHSKSFIKSLELTPKIRLQIATPKKKKLFWSDSKRKKKSFGVDSKRKKKVLELWRHRPEAPAKQPYNP